MSALTSSPCQTPESTHSHAWYAFSRVVRILARGAHSRAWYALARGAYSPPWYAFLRVVRICAWCALQPHLRIAQLEILQQLISVRFGKRDNFPDRFGSDMQKFRFNIGRFGLFFGTDYIGSYCLEGPIQFGIGIGPGVRTSTNRPNASSGFESYGQENELHLWTFGSVQNLVDM